MRSVQISSSGAVEQAAVPLEYCRLMLSGVVKLEAEPRVLGDLLEVQKMLSGLH